MYCRKEMSKWNETPKRVVMYFSFKIGKSQVETVLMLNQTRRVQKNMLTRDLFIYGFRDFGRVMGNFSDQLRTERLKDRRWGGNVQWRRRCRKRD